VKLSAHFDFLLTNGLQQPHFMLASVQYLLINPSRASERCLRTKAVIDTGTQPPLPIINGPRTNEHHCFGTGRKQQATSHVRGSYLELQLFSALIHVMTFTDFNKKEGR
jgi:hypothetical protein